MSQASRRSEAPSGSSRRGSRYRTAATTDTAALTAATAHSPGDGAHGDRYPGECREIDESRRVRAGRPNPAPAASAGALARGRNRCSRYPSAAAPAQATTAGPQPQRTSRAPAAHAAKPVTPTATGPAAASAGIGRRPAATPTTAPGTNKSRAVTTAARNTEPHSDRGIAGDGGRRWAGSAGFTPKLHDGSRGGANRPSPSTRPI